MVHMVDQTYLPTLDSSQETQDWTFDSQQVRGRAQSIGQTKVERTGETCRLLKKYFGRVGSCIVALSTNETRRRNKFKSLTQGCNSTENAKGFNFDIGIATW